LAGLGKSILGILDIDADLSFGDEDVALIHDVARRLVTEPGGLLDDPSYGYALQILLNSTVDAPSVQRRVVDQCLQEERLSDATAAVTQNLEMATMTVDVSITKKVGGTLTFKLELSLLTVELLLPDAA
jgi:hypothetical protein